MMKNKFLSIVLAGVMSITMSGCGGDSDNGGSGLPTGPETFLSVDVLDLDDGYIIYGYNDAGEDVRLEYCNGEYDYFSGEDIHAVGTFGINDDRVNMYDDDGGSYRIDTLNNLFEIDEIYYIDFQNDEITVEQITEDLDC